MSGTGIGTGRVEVCMAKMWWRLFESERVSGSYRWRTCHTVSGDARSCVLIPVKKKGGRRLCRVVYKQELMYFILTGTGSTGGLAWRGMRSAAAVWGMGTYWLSWLAWLATEFCGGFTHPVRCANARSLSLLDTHSPSSSCCAILLLL